MDSRVVSLSIFLLLALLAAFMGAAFKGGQWYGALLTPSWGPPHWMFILAWPCYYLLLVLAAWRLWLHHAATPVVAWVLWSLQLVLAVAWFWLFMGFHRPGWALAGLTVSIAVMAANLFLFTAGDRQAGRMLLPCMVWLVYLWAWNLAIWISGGGGWSTAIA